MTNCPTIYVITHLGMNHTAGNRDEFRIHSVDPRFFNHERNYCFYTVDEEPSASIGVPNEIREFDLDPQLGLAGKKHLGEWSFLLAEKKHAFCKYPFFMISSRFYMKNRWLKYDLNFEWDRLFSYFEKYRYGFLPSYDRPLRFVNVPKECKKPDAWFPFEPSVHGLTKQLFGVSLLENYTSIPDLTCNYLGFRSREDLLQYVDFYSPLLDFFFASNFCLKQDVLKYVRNTGLFPNEKPLTSLFEVMSHLFFCKKNIPFFALHYDGYYEVDNYKKEKFLLKKIPVPLYKKLFRVTKPIAKRLKTDCIRYAAKVRDKGVI